MNSEARLEYDPFSYEIHVDPYPTYRELREREPVYHNPRIGFWAITRFEDVWNATLDWQTFSSSAGPSIEMSGVPIPMMIAMDPPAHSINRGLVSKAFTPRRIAQLEPQIRQIVTGHLDRLVGRARFDAVADFSARRGAGRRPATSASCRKRVCAVPCCAPASPRAFGATLMMRRPRPCSRDP